MLSGTETRLNGGEATVSDAAQRPQLQRGLFSSSVQKSWIVSSGPDGSSKGHLVPALLYSRQWSQHFSTGLHDQRKRSLKVFWT